MPTVDVKKTFVPFFVLILMATLAFGQKDIESEVMEAFNRHEIGALLSHTHMRAGEVEGESRKRLSLPSFSIFYNFHIDPKWSVGLHTDFVAEQFVAQSLGGGKSIERERPIAPALMVGFKPGEHFTFLVGGGADIDPEETLGLIRIDSEYGLELGNEWEFIVALGYDIRIDAFDSFQLGLGVSKRF
ncbi:hypothetical protein [Allomuricauda sp. NBRC 101325]|uniref:hypothetical protein n=1 Tax=Allomuricauda sp. NBRC 101325 TaxID=1113758 RepID=UPI0024A0F890|nr:hypothetical protein [Muricauda sp. NBRC 101325]GLU45279.1 hypothetical protein Musp01_29030 [Muricauda sp. NBRC 101325]